MAEGRGGICLPPYLKSLFQWRDWRAGMNYLNKAHHASEHSSSALIRQISQADFYGVAGRMRGAGGGAQH